MKLSRIVEQIAEENVEHYKNVEITSIAYDSRKVQRGSLFVCLKGYHTDGHAYIDDVIERGAAALIVEDDLGRDVTCPMIQVKDTRYVLAVISALWFDYPAEKMKIIGLTGTKGKTTTAHMIKKILEVSGAKVGMIGTMGVFIADKRIPIKNTTPESYELHSLFDRMLKHGCEYVVMEASSQGFKCKRTAGVSFDYGAFLNISPDHIGSGEHENFEEYMRCKSVLFSQTSHAVVNIDDIHYKQITENAVEFFKISLHNKKEADIYVTDINMIWNKEQFGSTFHVKGKWNHPIALNMPGNFNIENALIAIAITSQLGIKWKAITEGMKQVSVKGRTQILKVASHFTTLLIDYAHNACSMEQLLFMLKQYQPRRLICLFGGGGNRPKARRYDMGAVAGKYADLTIITTDNPRFEKIEEINRDIIEGLQVHGGHYQIILDRKEAIEYLIDHAQKDDMIAFIGKGHEEYQDIEGEKIFFSEEQIVHDYLMTK